ncbi:YceG-like protein [Campylobacter iguaniorum]|uniref:endolytic transglycosylase MltG n=1 Tax=Campylobacter iguaniorum TaxID=1244531 RepID=UPI0007C9B6C3|nr:endolytic transglycosylase MltG [Campylobacter iguaniorum]ANE35973.1 YceG-like protein [Campylobacter iguaniorum]
MITKKAINRRIFFMICEIILIVFLSLFTTLARPIDTSKVVYLPNGSVSEIISYLSKRNFNVNKFDKYILVFMGFPQSGWIEIGQTRLSKFDFLYKLTTAKAALIDITLIPGETTLYFLKDLAGKLSLNYELLVKEYNAMSPIKEGYLVPETYKIPVGISEKHLVYYMINSSKKHHESIAKKIFGQWDEKKWFNFIIVASVIQKEAADASEMPLVASVIYNRLKKGMKLQMDGTLNYGLYSHEKITADRIRKDYSKYNTYIYEGLPDTAVCNVSLEAIKAAIFPKKTDYLYFVRNKETRKHKFSTTYNAHVKAISK